MPNTLAKHVLAEYLATKEPRYALLINAPWGAGKTEFIKNETNYENDPNILYLSLFGIDSVQAFNEAMLAAVLRAPGNEIKKQTRLWLESMKNIVSGSQAMGFSLNLSSFSLLEGLRKKLPFTLIFDDLERISMPQATVSGLLNSFIEHGKRRVILIANTDKINEDEKEAFDTSREKQIGRVIRIAPDFDAALQSYWVTIPTGHGTKYLKENQALIKDIFQEAQHGNLRLLRYALQATANLLNKVDVALYQFKEPIKKLTGTYLTLHMAYGGGRIGEADLAKRNDSRAFGENLFGKKTPDQQISALMELARAHPNVDIRVPYNGSPLPVELAEILLVRGYASSETINEELRKTHFFSPVAERPDWIKLWHWEELSVDELTKVLKRVDARLLSNEVTNPGEFIQIYGAMHWLARFNGLKQTQKQLSKTFLSYIEKLSQAGKIEPRLPSGRARELYVFGHEDGSVNYGGHVFDTDGISIKVVEALKVKMEKVYNAGLANVASGLLDKFEAATEEFLNQISYDRDYPNYSTAPILHLIDRSRFANRLLQLSYNDRELASQVMREIKARRQGHRGNLVDEHKWIDELKADVRAMASAESNLAGAKVEILLRREF